MSITLKDIDASALDKWCHVIRTTTRINLLDNLRYTEHRFGEHPDDYNSGHSGNSLWTAAAKKYSVEPAMIYERWWTGIWSLIEEEIIRRELKAALSE